MRIFDQFQITYACRRRHHRRDPRHREHPRSDPPTRRVAMLADRHDGRKPPHDVLESSILGLTSTVVGIAMGYVLS